MIQDHSFEDTKDATDALKDLMDSGKKLRTT
jgi:hypothetical protein